VFGRRTKVDATKWRLAGGNCCMHLHIFCIGLARKRASARHFIRKSAGPLTPQPGPKKFSLFPGHKTLPSPVPTWPKWRWGKCQPCAKRQTSLGGGPPVASTNRLNYDYFTGHSGSGTICYYGLEVKELVKIFS